MLFSFPFSLPSHSVPFHPSFPPYLSLEYLATCNSAQVITLTPVYKIYGIVCLILFVVYRQVNLERMGICTASLKTGSFQHSWGSLLSGALFTCLHFSKKVAICQIISFSIISFDITPSIHIVSFALPKTPVRSALSLLTDKKK